MPLTTGTERGITYGEGVMAVVAFVVVRVTLMVVGAEVPLLVAGVGGAGRDGVGGRGTGGPGLAAFVVVNVDPVAVVLVGRGG